MTPLRIFFTCAVLALSVSSISACGGDGKRVDSPASGGLAGSGGAASGGAMTGGAGGSMAECTAAPELGVRFVGRSDRCDASGVRYSWSGSGFVGAFSGTGIRVRLRDSTNQHTVLIDGELAPTLVATPGESWYTLATGLAAGEHRVEVYRRTEASFGVTVVTGIEVEQGELLAPPPARARRIEVIGDSISCGYGNEGTLPCSFSATTENHYMAYPAVLARSLEAELSTVAWSGKGVVYNYGGDKVYPLPTLYDRVEPVGSTNLWSFAYQPHAVVINLGTNDYSTGSGPPDDLFVSTYRGFLERLRGLYPDAYILCTVGPLLSGAQLSTARRNIQAAVDARIAAGDQNVGVAPINTPNTAPGCDWHPSVPVHAAMAVELEGPLRQKLGW